MKNLLLTGAGGFIGSHCIESLIQAGFNVNAVSSRIIRNHDQDGLTWHHADLHNAEHVLRLLSEVKPEYLLHLAWDVTPGLYWQSVANLRWVKSSLGLLQSFIESGGRRLVMVGSCAEYDWQYGYCREGLTPLNPQSLYGTCKNALRQVLEATAAGKKVSVAWGRLFSVYGPGEREERLVPTILTSLIKGEEAHCLSGHQVRDYMYVKDAAAAFTALLNSSVEGPVNIASGKPLFLSELASAAADFTGRQDLLKISSESKDSSEPDLLLAHTGRLTNEVGFKPAYSLSEGMQETGLWWKKRL